ncbi:MAG TPA: ABC transporter permease [Gammaproteobacteria bacterium]
MLIHYLTVALAAHRRRPLPTLLGVVTLAAGLACFLAAYGVAAFWDRADRHFANAERIFAVTSEWEFREVRDGAQFRTGVVPATNPWLAPYLRADFPALEAVARVVGLGPAGTVRADGPAAGPAVRLRALAADAELFRIFDLPFAAGDGRRALDAPGSVVLTRNAAERLFGHEPALGRTVVLGNRWEATVTGVLHPIPKPSHFGASAGAPLRFDLIASWDLFERVSAADGFDITRTVLLLLGGLVLAVACVDCANLAAARAARRAREVGLRKTLGASAYPAFLLARVPAAAALRTGRSRGGPGWLSAVLAGAQFAVAAFLLIAVGVVYAQNERLARTGMALTEAPLLVIENDVDFFSTFDSPILAGRAFDPGQMALMLVAEFAKPVLIANVIAWPLAYVAVRAYLNVFIDPIQLTPAPFAAALGATLLVALVSVAAQAIAAARAAPAGVLRHE